MRPSVIAAWPAIAREHEGFCSWPYCDVRGLVTTGIGSLFDDGTGDPPDQFLALPWVSGGRPATAAQIASGWRVTKGRTDLAPRGGHAFRDVTSLRLDARTIDGLLMARTSEFWSVLRAQLVNLETWPADAQLALIDMAYQLGPRFMGPKWPLFTAAAHAVNFEACSMHCGVRQASKARNQARVRWFANAADVLELGLDRDRLYDTEKPEEDEMALTDADLAKIRTLIRAELAALPKPATARDFAEAVLKTDGLIRNEGLHPTGGTHVTLATAIEQIAKRTQ